MTQRELLTVFQNRFNMREWQTVLRSVFNAKELRRNPEYISVSGDDEKGFYLGNASLSEGRKLGFFHYEIKKGNVALKKVGLRNLVKQFVNERWGVFDAAIVVFEEYGDGKNDENYPWRVSFICDLQDSATHPKRFSFVFGDPNSGYRTAVERFSKLLQHCFVSGNVSGSRTTEVLSLENIHETFSVEMLTKQFYCELFDWYKWALSEEMKVTFPNDTSTSKDDCIIEEHLIRLITRLVFVWFLKQKHLVPDEIFNKESVSKILNEFDADSGTYYNAILQNLFFATLNKPINERAFAAGGSHNNYQIGKEHYGIKTFFRDDSQKSFFKKEYRKNKYRKLLQLFSTVPFLNGGLFECLDKEKNKNGRIMYYDGFSREKGRSRRAFIPNILFFENERGLVNILKRYNFTVEENTPTDMEVALDPELLGKVFENLLGAYNPETGETARNQSGSFYTPREIVNYMVDEVLKKYLKKHLVDEKNIEKIFSEEDISDIDIETVKTVYNALLKIKIFDPACGSGAFPMGVLSRIVNVMEKIGLPKDINRYNLKLHLIEKCIFGADIQTIAVQISKLRFFISLVCEQKPDSNLNDNYGIKPMPNLETTFVAADTLISITKKQNGNLFEDPQIEVTKNELLATRHNHFKASTPKEKVECREKDEKLREKLASLLEKNNDFAPEEAKQLAAWNPYDQNSTSPFFDLEWMFGIKDGFDIVIGNPPYIQLQNNGGTLAQKYQNCGYKTFVRTGDIYSLFYERGWQFLKNGGHLCCITSNKWMRAGYGENTRKFFIENTNPELLVDFAGVKVFESATVDVNILMFSKDKNLKQVKACTVKKRSIKNLSVFVRQNAVTCNFATSESWVVLNSMEQRIKQKIESVGTPLKDWDINIYRGILTGYNEAFIINGAKKAELIAADPKSAEIIRPILRGKDIKKYTYEFADKWLINTHNGVKEKGINPININDYPSVKNHLDKYFPALEKRQDKGETPYNLRNCAYIEDFYRQKIAWKIIGSNINFLIEDEGFFYNNAANILTSNTIDLNDLIIFLNSKLFEWFFKKIIFVEVEGGGIQMFNTVIEKVPIVKNLSFETKQKIKKLLQAKDYKSIDKLVYETYQLDKDEIEFIEFQ